MKLIARFVVDEAESELGILDLIQVSYKAVLHFKPLESYGTSLEF